MLADRIYETQCGYGEGILTKGVHTAGPGTQRMERISLASSFLPTLILFWTFLNITNSSTNPDFHQTMQVVFMGGGEVSFYSSGWNLLYRPG